MIERRGGWAYFKKYVSAKKRIKATGFMNTFDYLKSVIAQFIVSLLPKKIRLFVFLKLLR